MTHETIPLKEHVKICCKYLNVISDFTNHLDDEIKNSDNNEFELDVYFEIKELLETLMEKQFGKQY